MKKYSQFLTVFLVALFFMVGALGAEKRRLEDDETANSSNKYPRLAENPKRTIVRLQPLGENDQLYTISDLPSEVLFRILLSVPDYQYFLLSKSFYTAFQEKKLRIDFNLDFKLDELHALYDEGIPRFELQTLVVFKDRWIELACLGRNLAQRIEYLKKSNSLRDKLDVERKHLGYEVRRFSHLSYRIEELLNSDQPSTKSGFFHQFIKLIKAWPSIDDQDMRAFKSKFDESLLALKQSQQITSELVFYLTAGFFTFYEENLYTQALPGIQFLDKRLKQQSLDKGKRNSLWLAQEIFTAVKKKAVSEVLKYALGKPADIPKVKKSLSDFIPTHLASSNNSFGNKNEHPEIMITSDSVKADFINLDPGILYGQIQQIASNPVMKRSYDEGKGVFVFDFGSGSFPLEIALKVLEYKKIVDLPDFQVTAEDHISVANAYLSAGNTFKSEMHKLYAHYCEHKRLRSKGAPHKSAEVLQSAYEQLEKLEPNNENFTAEDHLIAAEVYSRIFCGFVCQREKATKHMEKALEKGPLFSKVHRKAMSFYCSDSVRAIKHAEEVLRLKGGKATDKDYKRAIHYYHQIRNSNNFSRIAELQEKFILLQGNVVKPEEHEYAAKTYEQMGNKDKAEAHYQKAREKRQNPRVMTDQEANKSMEKISPHFQNQ